jgi:hypothetical protein
LEVPLVDFLNGLLSTLFKKIDTVNSYTVEGGMLKLFGESDDSLD